MSAGQAALPMFSVQCAFTSNPLDATQAWVEIAKLGRDFVTQRGRQHVLNAIEPGRLSLTALGTGRELDPTNTSGPYYPNVDINKRIRVGVVVNALPTAQAAITAGWVAGANTTLSYATNKLTLTATGSGTISANTPTGTSGARIAPNRSWRGLVTVTNQTTARTATCTLTWYDSTGATISSTNLANSDSGGFTYNLGPTTMPSNAATVSLKVSVASAGASEKHDVTLAGVLDEVIAAGAWYPGDCIPLYTGFIDGITPDWKSNVNTDIVITATDTLRILQQTKLPPDPFVTHAIANGATALWPLDDPAGQNYAREVVGGNTGSIGNFPLHPTIANWTLGTASRAPCIASTTILANPEFAIKNIPDSFQISGTGTWAIETWVQTTDTQVWPAIYNQGVGLGKGIYTALLGGATSHFQLGVSDNVTPVIVTGTRQIHDGKWHLVTALYDGTSYKIYVDGVLDASTTHTALNPAFPGTVFGPGSINIGGNVSCCTIYQNGMTDMSDAAVLANYQIGIGYWKTPEKSGTRCSDVFTPSFTSLPASLFAAPGSGSDSGQSNISPATTPPNTVLSYLQAVALAENGLVFARPDGVVVLYDRFHQINVTPTVTFGDGGGAEVPYKTRPEFTKDNVDLYNASTCTAVGGNPQTSKGTTLTQYGVTASLDQTGLMVAGPTTAANSADPEMLNRAQWNVGRYQTPVLRVRTIVVDMISYLAQAAPLVLQSQPNQVVEIGQQVTIKRRPWDSVSKSFGSPVFTQVSMIEGIDHDISAGPGGYWRMTLHLSPADTTQYWVLGTSALDTTTVLGY